MVPRRSSVLGCEATVHRAPNPRPLAVELGAPGQAPCLVFLGVAIAMNHRAEPGALPWRDSPPRRRGAANAAPPPSLFLQCDGLKYFRCCDSPSGEALASNLDLIGYGGHVVDGNSRRRFLQNSSRTRVAHCVAVKPRARTCNPMPEYAVDDTTTASRTPDQRASSSASVNAMHACLSSGSVSPVSKVPTTTNVAADLSNATN